MNQVFGPPVPLVGTHLPGQDAARTDFAESGQPPNVQRAGELCR